VGPVQGKSVALERGVNSQERRRPGQTQGWGNGRVAGVLCLCLFLSFWARGKTQMEEQQRDMMGRETVLWMRCLFSAGQDDRRLWRGRGEGTCGLGWALVGGSRGIIHGRGHAEQWRGRGSRTEAAMQVGYKSSVRERVESEESRLWELGDRRDGEKPQV
jgi:hypothetical protein